MSGEERSAELHRPAGHDPARRAPLLVVLHGCTQSAQDIARGTRMNVAADENDFFVLYPQQPERYNIKKCWNWFDPSHQERDAGEPAIIASMIERTVGSEPIDRDRVYLAGISAGAAMASLVAVAYPEIFAGLALHSGLPWRAATSVVQALDAMRAPLDDPATTARAAFEAMGSRARAIPTIVLHGAADGVVGPSNARATAEQWLETDRLALGRAEVKQRTERVEESGRYPATVTRWMFGGDRPLIEEWMIERLGHAWSGGSPEGTFTDANGPAATDAILRFFGLSEGRS